MDNYCRVMDAGGNPLPHLFAIGLAAGFVPYGKLGGETSFRGQANGLWLWQNDVGAMIADAILVSPALPRTTYLNRPRSRAWNKSTLPRSSRYEHPASTSRPTAALACFRGTAGA